MALYALTRWTSGVKNSVDEALEALETQLETVDDAKTIRLVDIELTGRDRDQAVAVTLYDT